MPKKEKQLDPKVMNPAFLALSRLRRRKFDSSIDLCTNILNENPLDQQVWFMKCRGMTLKNYIDDTDLEEEGVADILMDENSMAKAPRPGTSLSRPLTKSGSSSGSINQSIRPMSGSNRPLTGFARPGTQSRLGTGSRNDLAKSLQGGRPGTSRPVSVAGRYVRLGTQSMLSDGANFINVDRLDFKKYAKRPGLAKVLLDFILYHDHNPKKGLELASEATQASEYKDWWWKARLGKCYYQLGMFRDAERQFNSAQRQQNMITTSLELGKIYLRLDQPNTALDNYQKALEQHEGDTALLLGHARVYDALNDLDKGVSFYKQVLKYDSSNAEAMACLASHHFYSDQPEIALRFYRRLLQMGINNTEIWNNLGLGCFYASQYDMTLSCFQRALAMASDDNMADVWYNIGQVAIGIGDLNLAYQAFKIAISVDANHAESFNNLGILELRKGHIDQAASNFETSYKLAPHMFEPFFNAALVAFKLGDCQDSFDNAQKSIEAFPDHTDSKELIKQLKKHFTML